MPKKVVESEKLTMMVGFRVTDAQWKLLVAGGRNPHAEARRLMLAALTPLVEAVELAECRGCGVRFPHPAPGTGGTWTCSKCRARAPHELKVEYDEPLPPAE